MHFEINAEDHKSAINTVAANVVAASKLPILTTIRVEAEASGRISYVTTDLDTTITARAQGVVTTPGVACLPAKKLQEIAKETGDSTLSIKSAAEDVTISFDRSRFKILGMDGDNWPTTPAIDRTGSFRIPGAELAAMIETTLFAVSKDETKGLLQGLLWEMLETGMRMVGCDGHRLAIADRPGLPKGRTAGAQYVLHSRAAALIQKTVASAAAVDVILTRDRAAFAVPGIQIVTSLLPGGYPDYRMVMPKTHTRTLEADRAPFIQAVRRMSVLANKNSRVCFDFKAPMVRLWSEGGDVGTSEDKVSVQFTGDPMRMDLNAQYLLEVLGKIDGDRFTMHLTKSSDAAILRAPGEDTRSEFMLMPLRAKA